MTDDTLIWHLAQRQAKARRFIENPERYMVCEGCSSISPISAALCPICGTYRFSRDPERVVMVAYEIGEVPFPRTAGVVPRL